MRYALRGLTGVAALALATVSSATVADQAGAAGGEPVTIAAMQPIATDPVETTTGKIAGTHLASGVKAYLGIPFAAPPTGDLRWRAPQPIHWSGVWNADRKGPECIQVLRPHNINHYFGEEPSSEDCLYMNIWEPAKADAASKLPVIVFIYGGGFTIGSSGMPNYAGENVAENGAVFVNFNYRVGAFGFLAHPELTREQGGHSGNYGLMDQAAALRWVHDNIARFGGDPDKVLIMGQSAGANSVANQIFSPLSKGLFRAAVMSSGCSFDREGPSLAEAEKVGLQLQAALHASSLDDMRQMPADRILALQSEFQVGADRQGVRMTGPIIDGYVLPQAKAALLEEHRFNAVPIIASYNGADLDFRLGPLTHARTVAGYREAAQRLFGADADAFLKLYPVASDADVLPTARRAARDAGFELSARGCARDQTRYAGEPTYIDTFTRHHPYIPGVKIADLDPATAGAYHTADIPYWLGTLDTLNALHPTRRWTDWDRHMSSVMMHALIAFAATGDPSTSDLKWPAWSAQAPLKVVFGDQITTRKLDNAQLDWFAAHPPKAVAMPARTGPRD